MCVEGVRVRLVDNKRKAIKIWRNVTPTRSSKGGWLEGWSIRVSMSDKIVKECDKGIVSCAKAVNNTTVDVNRRASP